MRKDPWHGYTTSRPGKLLTFKPKALSLYTADVCHIKTDQMFGFWVIQSFKSCRNTCFCGVTFSLVVKSQVAKPEILVLSKTWTSTYCLLKDANLLKRLLANQLGGFEYNFKCLKSFTSRLPRRFWSTFLLVLRLLKISLSVRWLKCLLLSHIRSYDQDLLTY